MTLRPCVVCGTPTERSRCDEHKLKDSRPKPAAANAGYDWSWRKLSRRARRLQPFCSDCGATSDLQADHSPEAWRRKERGLQVRLQDIDVVCGDCNRRRGAARGEDVRRDPGDIPPTPTSSCPGPHKVFRSQTPGGYMEGGNSSGD